MIYQKETAQRRALHTLAFLLARESGLTLQQTREKLSFSHRQMASAKLRLHVCHRVIDGDPDFDRLKSMIVHDAHVISTARHYLIGIAEG